MGVVEWLAAGVAFPLTLFALLGPQPPGFFPRFFVSLGLCGLMAAVYPFFGITFVVVRVLLPPLLRRRPPDAAERAGLERLKRRTGLYLLLAAAAPMLAVAAWAALGSENRTELGILSGVGLLGFAAAFGLSRAIQADAEALLGAAASSAGRSAARE